MGITIKNASNYSSGEVFYYKSKKRVFGCVVLFQQQDYFLIAISEEIAKTTKTICVDDVLESELYTLAWFSDVDMLSPRRLHLLGTIPLAVDYTNREGLMNDNHGVLLKNVGQKATWAHEFRSFALRNTFLKDVLSQSFVPKAWH